MAGYIEDRWLTKRPDPATGKRRRTARYGQGKRYRVAGIPGVKDRSFASLGGPDGANAWKAKAEHEAAKGEFIDPRDGSITLRVYFEKHWWPGKKGDPATLLAVEGKIRNHVLPHLGHKPLNSIRTPQLRDFVAALDGSTSDSTAYYAWGQLSTLLQAAVDDERITKNYCRAQTSVRPPSLPERKARAWPKEHVLAVRKAMPARYRAMVDVGVGAGLRQGEVLGLAVDDIDAKNGLLYVRRQVKKIGSKLVFALPKGGKTRTVPIPPYLVEELERHLEALPARSVTLPWGNPAPGQTEQEKKDRAPRTFNLIFTAPRGGAIRRESFDTHAWKPALSTAGLIGEPEVSKTPIKSRPGLFRTVKKYAENRELGFHALRHTFASVMLDERENPVAVSKWLGHADPSITLRIYAHMMPEADGRGRKAMQAWFTLGS